MLSGRGLCDGPIPHPENKCGVLCVCVCECANELVEVVRYKPEVGGFDSLRCQLNFSLTLLGIGRTMALGATQRLTEMSTRNVSCWVEADNVTIFMCRLSRNLGASTFWNRMGL